MLDDLETKYNQFLRGNMWNSVGHKWSSFVSCLQENKAMVERIFLKPEFLLHTILADVI